MIKLIALSAPHHFLQNSDFFVGCKSVIFVLIFKLLPSCVANSSFFVLFLFFFSYYPFRAASRSFSSYLSVSIFHSPFIFVIPYPSPSFLPLPFPYFPPSPCPHLPLSLSPLFLLSLFPPFISHFLSIFTLSSFLLFLTNQENNKQKQFCLNSR